MLTVGVRFTATVMLALPVHGEPFNESFTLMVMLVAPVFGVTLIPFPAAFRVKVPPLTVQL